MPQEQLRIDRRRFLQAATVLVAAAAGGCSSRTSSFDPVISEDVAFAFDPQGNRYEMDFMRGEVRRVDAGGAVVWRQGSPSDTALFNSPTSMAVDADGAVYVADRGNGEIERLDAQGVHLTTFGEDLLSAQDLALDASTRTLYVSDGTAHQIRAFSLEGQSLPSIGAFGTQGAGLNFPRGVAISPDRELHVVDSGNARIQVFGLEGGYRRTYGGPADAAGELRVPRDIVFTAGGDAIVSDPMLARLAWFDSRGAFVFHSLLHRPGGQAGHPLYLAIGPDSRLYATVI